jgi:hypothetical protein
MKRPITEEEAEMFYRRKLEDIELSGETRSAADALVSRLVDDKRDNQPAYPPTAS